MLQAVYDLRVSYWSIFVIYWIIIFCIMTVRTLGAIIFHTAFKYKKIFNFPSQPQLGATVFVTIFDEDIEKVKYGIGMVRTSFDKYCRQCHIVCTIDGAHIHPEYAESMIETIKPIVDVIYTTNVCSKRKNLRNMMANSKKLGILHDIIIFMDSDTMPDDLDIAHEVMRPFADPKIGGVTTSQRIYNPNTVPRLIADWIEHARICSSMAAGSLVGEVGCLPGRLYAIRREIVQDKMDELVEDWWGVPWSRDKVQCFAGDDRVITNFVLKAGYKTIMMPSAGVKTCMPSSFFKMFKQWERWGRSSQGYTLRTLDWSWKQPWIFFQNTSDIFITVSTCYIMTIHWVLIFFVYSKRPEDISLPISTSLMYFMCGTLLTILYRHFYFLVTQCIAHRKPWIVLIVPVFYICIAILHLIRFYSLCTPHKIGVWGTREGADDDSVINEDIFVKRVFMRPGTAICEEDGSTPTENSGTSRKNKKEETALDIDHPMLHSTDLVDDYINSIGDGNGNGNDNDNDN